MGLSRSVLSNANMNSSIGIALLDKALDLDQDNGDAMVKMMERSVNPLVGQNIDVRL